MPKSVRINAIRCVFHEANNLFLAVPLRAAVQQVPDRDVNVRVCRKFLILPSPACAILPRVGDFAQGAPLMEWVTPQHEEIDLNCEVSSYANAEL